jgi:hypothetical protein
LDAALEMGMDWSVREGYAWAEDKEHCEVKYTCFISVVPVPVVVSGVSGDRDDSNVGYA